MLDSRRKHTGSAAHPEPFGSSGEGVTGFGLWGPRGELMLDLGNGLLHLCLSPG